MATGTAQGHMRAEGRHGPDPREGAHALVLAGEPFTPAELQALGARGVVVPLLPGVWATPADAGRPTTRAEALWVLGGPVLAAGWTTTGPSAAWVLAGGAAPSRLHAAVPHFHRLPAGGCPLPWTLTQSDVAAGPEGCAPAEADVLRLGPLRVTTPQRTVEDLLLSADPDSARRAAAVIAAHGAEGLRRRLSRRSGRSGVVAARRRLDALLDALGVEG